MIEIRQLLENDAPAWWRLRLKSLVDEPHAFGNSVEEHVVRPVEVIAERLREPGEHDLHLGVFDGEQLVGMARFEGHAGVKERHKGYIFGLYVAREYRRRGLGKALLAAIVERAKSDPLIEQILLGVSAPQTAAVALYGSFGFESYGIEPNALKVGDEYVDEVCMILRLR